MKPKYIKTLINQLVKKIGSKNETAIQLGISSRYIYMLQKKERKASPTLVKLIELLLKG